MVKSAVKLHLFLARGAIRESAFGISLKILKTVGYSSILFLVSSTLSACISIKHYVIKCCKEKLLLLLNTFSINSEYVL